MSSGVLKETLGAVLVGSGFAATLTGVVAMQTAYYFMAYPDDKPPMKLTVALVWLLDLLHTTMIFVADWSWLIEHFDDPGIYKHIPWPVAITVLLTTMISVTVNSFFAFRIHGLSKGNWFVVGPILVLVVIRLALASTSSARMFIHPTFAEFAETTKWIVTVGLVNSSILDVAITSCLLWYLDHARTGFAEMDRIINTLCLYAIENGLLTSLVILISLGCWLGMGRNLVFLAIHFAHAKLYANSLLATLNSRKHIRERGRRACSSDGAQVVTMFNLPRGPSLKSSTDHLGTIRDNKEKSRLGHDEEAGVALSPISSQAAMTGDSVETASTWR